MCMLLFMLLYTILYLGIFRNYEHYDIFVLKQNNLLVIKVSF